MPDSPPVLLVVDDEPGVLSLVERFAQGEGFDTITRAGGHELLAELPAIRPDVALLDRNMPEVGGLDILPMNMHADVYVRLIAVEGEVLLPDGQQRVTLKHLMMVGSRQRITPRR